MAVSHKSYCAMRMGAIFKKKENKYANMKKHAQYDGKYQNLGSR